MILKVSRNLFTHVYHLFHPAISNPNISEMISLDSLVQIDIKVACVIIFLFNPIDPRPLEELGVTTT